MDELDKAYNEYQKAYEKRKNEMLSKLETIREYPATTPTFCQWLDQVIEFIKEEK